MPKRFAFPILAVLVVFALYSAYWVYARSEIEAYVENWQAEQLAAGYQIEHADIRIGGYPYRFSVASNDVVIRAPETEGGWILALDSFEANALPYDFSHWVVSLGEQFSLEQNGDGMAFTARSARFSIAGEANVTNRIGVSIEGLSIAGIGDARPAITSAGNIGLSAATRDTGEMLVQVQLDNVELAPGSVDPILVNSFGTSVTVLRADFILTEWPELARSADLAVWAQASGQSTLRGFEIDWGRLDMAAEGQMTLDSQLRPSGRLSLNLLDPEAVVDAIVESGSVSEESAGALRLVAQSAPRSDTGTSIPLSFRNGGVFFGPVRLGEVGPVLR
ncbi:DUF2125 domain-containing protein [Hyphobacterium sp. HN65]|uniref:DUF2125 domain-containing protein n=1 Tax=Hyphobacterium lacteum TaxID=3116575 RepID=A0ABU7LQY0_9PROT|nr:DUF2125 domain-containing protein [Hyphobacterium sp. HN65]MEE2525999.1 DUF2125 domain-containing protein [Hyphobacterium sp. HN65]